MDIQSDPPVSEADGPQGILLLEHMRGNDVAVASSAANSAVRPVPFDPTLCRFEHDVFTRREVAQLVSAFDDIDLHDFYRESMAYMRRTSRDIPREIAVYYDRYQKILNCLIRLRQLSLNLFPHIQNYLWMDASAWRDVMSYLQQHRDELSRGIIFCNGSVQYRGPSLNSPQATAPIPVSLEEHLRERLPRLDLRHGTYQNLFQRGVTFLSRGTYAPSRSFEDVADFLVIVRDNLIPALKEALAEYLSLRSSAVARTQRGTAVAVSGTLEDALPELRRTYELHDRFLAQLEILEERVVDMLNGGTHQFVEIPEDVILLLKGLQQFFSHK